uniref:Uncharacterized protein n=1 Tax=Micrurus spixii TaxID=129469 RepID=A0A2D4MPY8_9SAUR
MLAFELINITMCSLQQVPTDLVFGDEMFPHFYQLPFHHFLSRDSRKNIEMTLLFPSGYRFKKMFQGDTQVKLHLIFSFHISENFPHSQFSCFINLLYLIKLQQFRA